MTTRSDARNGGAKIETHPRYDCVKLDAWRYWRHVATSYTKDRNADWWSDNRDYQDTLQCG